MNSANFMDWFAVELKLLPVIVKDNQGVQICKLENT